MEHRLKELEEEYRREKEEANQQFERQRKDYEFRIASLQEQVERQSMMSSFTQDDLDLDEPIIEECRWTDVEFRLARWAFAKWRCHQFTSLRVSVYS